MEEKGRRRRWLRGFVFLIVLTLPIVSFAEFPAQWRYMITERNVNALKSQLDRGGDVNSRDEKGETLLIYAVKRNRPEIVKMLVEKGADISAKDESGKTALDYAKEFGYSEITQLLEGK